MAKRAVIRNQIASLRKQHGLTQAALAEAVGVTRQTIIAIERNRYSPSLETAFRIAAVFSQSIDEVFEWLDGKEKVID
ncbi:MAG: helix-turn-helix transcriptional regulator [Pseudomonadota bacterium]